MKTKVILSQQMASAIIAAGRESGSSGVGEISENEEINNESNHNPEPFTH